MTLLKEEHIMAEVTGHNHAHQQSVHEVSHGQEETRMTSEAQEHYCPICGKEVTDPTWNRFGEWCCSETHAEEYVKEVRAGKQATHAAPREPVAVAPEEAYEPRRPAWGWGRRRGGC